MEKEKMSFLKRAIKYGIVMGICFCLYTTFMWLTKLDTKYLEIGEYLDMTIIILPIIVIFIAIKNEIKFSEVNILKRIGIGLTIGIISCLIYSPFLYFYHNYINPEWFNSVLSLAETKLIEIKTEPQIIAEKIQRMRENNLSQKAMFNVGAIIPSVIIMPIFISLLSTIFIRKRKKN